MTHDTHDNLCNAVTFAQIARTTRPHLATSAPQTARQRRRGAVSANSNILQTLVQGSSERFHDTLQKFILRRLVRNAAWAGLGWAGLGWAGWAGLGGKVQTLFIGHY